VRPRRIRAIRNMAMTTIPRRRYGKANSGSNDTVRLQQRQSTVEPGSRRQTRYPPACACRIREPSEDDALHTAGSAPAR
jgi:hypothetical protein